MEVDTVIGLCDLRRDGQNREAKRRKHDSGARRLYAYQADAPFRAQPGLVGAATPVSPPKERVPTVK